MGAHTARQVARPGRMLAPTLDLLVQTVAARHGCARPALPPRCKVVVVLAAPPFWFSIAVLVRHAPQTSPSVPSQWHAATKP